jgi:transposase-like protein
MFSILAGIYSLIQYKTEFVIGLNKEFRPTRCPCCGRENSWRHGPYVRNADRLNNSCNSLNPIFIQRYFCPSCKKTCSVLPECIPPRRWYLWETQQEAIILFLLGNSARAVEKQVKPSRHTIMRWVAWLIVQFNLHKDTLCNYFPSFGLFTEPVAFWKHLFDKLPFCTAMRLCHVSGVPIP